MIIIYFAKRKWGPARGTPACLVQLGCQINRWPHEMHQISEPSALLRTVAVSWLQALQTQNWLVIGGVTTINRWFTTINGWDWMIGVVPMTWETTKYYAYRFDQSLQNVTTWVNFRQSALLQPTLELEKGSLCFYNTGSYRHILTPCFSTYSFTDFTRTWRWIRQPRVCCSNAVKLLLGKTLLHG